MASTPCYARLLAIAKIRRLGFTAAVLTLGALTVAPTAALAQMQEPVTPAAKRSQDRLKREPVAAETAADDGNGQDRCLSVAEINDRDGDFTRNRSTLSSPNLCLMQQTFNEGPLVWKLQIIRNTTSPQSYFWFVPHDNENVAFDTAVYGVARYGGTVVAVETGGSRFNGPQDPNRNFDAGGRRCPQQIAASPLYTAAVTRWRSNETPVIALHSNERGYNGDGHGGAGGISILKPLPGNTPYPAPNPLPTRSPSDSIVFVASTGRGDAELSSLIAAMNNAGLNVMREFVSPGNNDCSFSNYAALTRIPKYVNIEVVHGDGAGQKKMLNVVLSLLSGGGAAESAAAPSDETPAIVKKRPPRKQGMPAATAKPAKKKLAKQPVKPKAVGSKPKPKPAKPVASKPATSKPVTPKPATPKPNAKKPAAAPTVITPAPKQQ
jgi:hypothetical protein